MIKLVTSCDRATRYRSEVLAQRAAEAVTSMPEVYKAELYVAHPGWRVRVILHAGPIKWYRED